MDAREQRGSETPFVLVVSRRCDPMAVKGLEGFMDKGLCLHRSFLVERRRAEPQTLSSRIRLEAVR